MKKKIIRFFGLKGSWSWAKNQMLKGHIVRCKHFTGSLKYKIDSPENRLLLCTFQRENKQLQNGAPIWEAANFHFSVEEHIDYEVVSF